MRSWSSQGGAEREGPAWKPGGGEGASAQPGQQVQRPRDARELGVRRGGPGGSPGTGTAARGTAGAGQTAQQTHRPRMEQVQPRGCPPCLWRPLRAPASSGGLPAAQPPGSAVGGADEAVEAHAGGVSTLGEAASELVSSARKGTWVLGAVRGLQAPAPEQGRGRDTARPRCPGRKALWALQGGGRGPGRQVAFLGWGLLVPWKDNPVGGHRSCVWLIRFLAAVTECFSGAEIRWGREKTGSPTPGAPARLRDHSLLAGLPDSVWTVTAAQVARGRPGGSPRGRAQPFLAGSPWLGVPRCGRLSPACP